ncbi:MAG TPA: class I SAM-dependent methyltransferase [Pyrinomonadaceae bacterium]|nr:class I SAM-dependent methyltransferase [Pyrinomonadaceae bacterium]
MKPTNPFHSANHVRWEAASENWKRSADSRGTWRRCPTEPELVLSERELRYLSEIAGKRVCVLGSGDNQVVFALAGLGALVTSVDISQNQLQVAAQRSHELGLSIEFVQSDVTDLSAFSSESFDAVYTGGHVALWVADLLRFYAESARILAPGGLLMISEYHPFRRIWKESPTTLSVESRYLDRGPFEYDYTDNVLSRDKGSLKSYEYHWTVADYLNSVISSGCSILFVDEFGEAVGQWEGAPLAGLPEFLLIVARKEL